MSDDKTHDAIGPRRARFDTTRWSLVVSAGSETSSAGQAALAELCERYWYPLYAYVRRRHSDIHEAQDLTQAFFARLLEKNYVADADPDRGRFRTFLLAALNHFLANEWNRARAQKRGGAQTLVSLDLEEGERRYQRMPADELTPERLFERQWVMTLLKQVLARLRQEAIDADRLDQFESLESTLTVDQPQAYASLAEQLGMTAGAVKTAAHRLRKRYRELIRVEIGQTLDDSAAADEEIRRLFQTFS